MSEFTTIIDRECHPHDGEGAYPMAVRVRGTWEAGSPGYSDEPPSSPIFDLDTITDLEGNDVDLTDDEVDQVIEAAYNGLPDRDYDPPDDMPIDAGRHYLP